MGWQNDFLLRLHLRACRNVDCWISSEEIDRFERDLDHLSWHDWKVFNSWNVLQSELNPKYDILVNNVIATRSPRSYSISTLTLIGVLPSREILVIPVLCDIYRVISKSVYVSQ